MIFYRAEYKYQLTKTCRVNISVQPRAPIETKYISLSTGGLLTIRGGYAWDGPSGPTIDTANFMRGSLVHDALYQLIRMGLLSIKHFDAANLELRRICREDGMSRFRSWYVWRSVHRFGKGAATAARRPILTAP